MSETTETAKIERTIRQGLSGKGKGRGGEVQLRGATILGWSDKKVSVHFFSRKKCKDGTAYVKLSRDEALALARSILYATGLPSTIMLSRRQNKYGAVVVESYSNDGKVDKEVPDGKETHTE